MTWGSNKMHFTYDSNGPMSVLYNGTEYFYLKNAQGDITGMVDTSGSQVVSYSYNAWGDPVSTEGSMKDTLGAVNPFRYRSYVYDAETDLYYGLEQSSIWLQVTNYPTRKIIQVNIGEE